MGQCPGKREQLTLARGEVRAPLSKFGLVALGETLDELVGPHGPRRAFDLGRPEILSPQQNIVAHRAAEKKDILEHRRHPGPQFALGNISHVHPVHQDSPPGHLVEPGEQVDHRGLARTGCAHKGHPLARFDLEGKIPQNPILSLVGEPDPLELHRTQSRGGRGKLGAPIRVFDGDVRVEQLKDSLATRHGGLHHRILGRQILQGPQETPHIVDELVEDPGFHESRSHPNDHRDRDTADGLDHGEEKRVVANRLVPGISMIRVHTVEFTHIPGFPGEELNHLHAADGFLDMRVDAGDANAHGAKGLAHLQAKDHRRHREEGNRRKCRQGEFRIDIEEHHREADHLEDIADQRHDAGCKHFRHVLDVVRCPGHQPPHRIAIEESKVEFLDLVEDGPANIPHRGLTRHRHQDHVGELQTHPDQGHEQVKESQPGQGRKTQGRIEDPGRRRAQVLARLHRLECVVEPGLDNPGWGEFDQENGKHHQQRHRHLPPVGRDVAPKQNQQAGIVRLAQGLLFVEEIAHEACPPSLLSRLPPRSDSSCRRRSAAACSLASRE